MITDPTIAEQTIADAPAYAEFVLHTERAKDIVLMARDFPKAGRRCTNITHGTEWFNITADTLRRIGFVGMEPR